MQWHLKGMGIELRQDRHKDAPSVASESDKMECSTGAMNPSQDSGGMVGPDLMGVATHRRFRGKSGSCGLANIP